MSENLALKIDDLDNVATIFANGMKRECPLRSMIRKDIPETITLLDDIPYGHKIALCDLAPGDLIMKYGECIGTASHPIKKGNYVHVHNLDARRGRGDL